MEIIPGEHQICYKFTIKINNFKKVFKTQEEVRTQYIEIVPGKNIAIVVKKQPDSGSFLFLELLAGEAVDPPRLAGFAEISLGNNSQQFKLGDALGENYLQFDAISRTLVLPGQFGWALTSSGSYGDALQIKFKLFTQSEEKTLPESLKSSRYLSTQTMRIMKDESTADLKITCGERDNKKVFAVHKSFFCASSPVFRAAIESDMVEGRTKEIYIEEVDEKTLQKLIHYVYTGELTGPDLNIQLVAWLADKYDLPGMKELLCFRMREDTDNENIADMLIAAGKLQ